MVNTRTRLRSRVDPWFLLCSGLIKQLLKHCSTLFSYLGGDSDKALREWFRLKRYVMKNDTLSSLSYLELYQRLFDQNSDKDKEQHYYNIPLLIAMMQSKC